MFLRFKNIKIRVFIVHLVITLFYPVAKALISEYNRLLIFSDSLTIIGLLLIALGIGYTFVLHGDFDRTGFVFMRGMKSKEPKTYREYTDDAESKREDAFNYPLFLGILFILVSVFMTYVVL